jgi:hypothetical protein
VLAVVCIYVDRCPVKVADFQCQDIFFVPLHAMEALGGRGGIAPTHSRPRH